MTSGRAFFELSAPHVESWLTSLNIVRDVSARHGRLLNPVFAMSPKLSKPRKRPHLDAGSPFTRTLGQLALAQQLQKMQAIGNQRLLPAVVRPFPSVPSLPIRHLGAWFTGTISTDRAGSACSPIWTSGKTHAHPNA